MYRYDNFQTHVIQEISKHRRNVQTLMETTVPMQGERNSLDV